MPVMQLQGLGLAYPHKPCFAGFNASLQPGQRIAVIGANGSGKSSLLQLLAGTLEPSEGRVLRAPGLVIGQVSQLLPPHLPQHSPPLPGRSGGQRVQQALSDALALQPDVLLLDEPSNHLDRAQRGALLRKLQAFAGSIVLASHDAAWMDQLCDTLWHIEHGRISVFKGRHRDWLAARAQQQTALDQQLLALKRAKQQTHEALMQEQERARHARLRGAQSVRERKWATVRSPTKLGRANTTGLDKQAALQAQQRELAEARALLATAEPLRPRFHLPAAARRHGCLLQISQGAAGYGTPVLQRLDLGLARGERLALLGANGSGKSTLARALCGDPAVQRQGDWQLPVANAIGYLDQHYADLPLELTVLEALQQRAPGWSSAALHHHLSNFLFRGHAAVDAQVATLSGGERARLAWACMAACTPELLILDEPSNHLDASTRQHLIEVLRAFPGALLVISHDLALLRRLDISTALLLQPGGTPRLAPLPGAEGRAGHDA